jgi:beta-ribofuranosylaminobenzene 5'-phosphate synthase
MPRIHLTLIGMDAIGYRSNGGLGFSIDSPTVRVALQCSDRSTVADRRKYPLNESERIRLLEVAETFAEFPVKLELTGDMPSHCGFGSATAIRLATIEAVASIKGQNLTDDEIVRLSGRGGTSGVGVNTYFNGRFVFDVGVRAMNTSYLPSSSVEGMRLPPLVIMTDNMPNWEVGICIPSSISLKTAAEEVEFFTRTCPIPVSAVKDTLYEAVYGISASIREADFETFCRSIREIQRQVWKRLERELYGEPLFVLEREIYAAGAKAVGMSSLGPGLFFLGSDLKAVVEALRIKHPSHGWILSRCINSGRIISAK